MDLTRQYDDHPVIQFAERTRGWCSTTAHTEALVAIARAVEHRHGYACVIGEIGTGKSELLGLYAKAAAANGVRTVRVAGGHYDKTAFIQYILNQLRVTTEGKSAAWLRRRLQLAARFHLALNKPLAILIDDADRLENDVLSQLHLLVDCAAGQERVLQIVLAGTPELQNRLRTPLMQPVDQRIGVRVTIQAVDVRERLNFIETVLLRDPLPHGYKLSRWNKRRIARKSLGNAQALTRLTREAAAKVRARTTRSVKPIYTNETAAET